MPDAIRQRLGDQGCTPEIHIRDAHTHPDVSPVHRALSAGPTESVPIRLVWDVWRIGLEGIRGKRSLGSQGRSRAQPSERFLKTPCDSSPHSEAERTPFCPAASHQNTSIGRSQRDCSSMHSTAIGSATCSPPSKPVYRREDGFWPSPHTHVLRQVHPADCAGRINEEFGGSRDVFTA